jgi:2-dehydropantoate 2-reductase
MAGQVAVVSAGAIGSSVAADLTRAGVPVAVIDQWPEHVEAMKADGLRVAMADGQEHTPVEAYHLCEVSSLRREFDVVLLAAKSHDTVWLAHFIKPYLKADGVVVGLQNGMNNDALIDVMGGARVIGCVVELSAEVFTPGMVQRNTDRHRTWFGLGELDGGLTPRLTELKALMANAGRVSLTDNIEGAKWTKLVNSSMILAPFACLGLRSYEAVEIPRVRELCARLGSETMRVGAAHGYRIEAIFGRSPEEFDGPDEQIVETLLYALLHDLGKASHTARGVVLQDFLKGRRTETAHLNGLVSRKGREAGIPTPANDAVVSVCQRIERGELTPDPTNVDELWELTARGGTG